jgi:hypothetical protein
LAWFWSQWNSQILMIKIQNSVATLENSLVVSYKFKIYLKMTQ